MVVAACLSTVRHPFEIGRNAPSATEAGAIQISTESTGITTAVDAMIVGARATKGYPRGVDAIDAGEGLSTAVLAKGTKTWSRATMATEAGP